MLLASPGRGRKTPPHDPQWWSSAHSRRTFGALLALLGTLWVSPDSLLIRLSESEQPAPGCVLFYKYSIKLVTLTVAFLIMHGGPRNFFLACRSSGWHFVIAGVTESGAALGFNLATMTTSASNATLLVEISPVWCAILSYAIFREKPPFYTVASMTVAFSMAVVIFAGSETDGRRGVESLFGDALAVGGGIALATHLTVIRDASYKYPEADMMCTVWLGTLVTVLASAVISRGHLCSQCAPKSGARGLVWILLTGSLTGTVSDCLMAVAPKYCPATVVALIVLLDGILSPLWVWMALGEKPLTTTFIGGAGLMATLVYHEIVAASASNAKGEQDEDLDIVEVKPSPRETTHLLGAAGALKKMPPASMA
mmetsp:Transcript_17316/g.40326  ORF Transcript_17316/g.40326 Transcript_17316/m.40326 type:complete len:369 (-) Transcript_17316:165-1271(-)